MVLTVFIDMAGFALVLPILPFWAERFGADATTIGLLLTAYAAAQLMFTPVLGGLSDRYGRRPVIVGALLLEAAGLLITALAINVPVLLVGRFVSGMGGSSLGSAQAVVADVTPAEGRARGMGLVGAAIGVGFVVGPAFGALLSGIGQEVPFWAAAGIAALNAMLVARFLPETRKPGSTTTERGTALAMLRRQGIRRLILVTLLSTLAFTAMETVVPLLTQQRYGWGPIQNGMLFAYVGILMVIVQGGLVGRMAGRISESTLLLGGLCALGFGLGVVPLGGGPVGVFVALGLIAVGEAMVSPASSALLSFASGPGEQGRTLGLARGAGSLARIVGPAVAGALFARAGASAPFMVGSVLGFGSAGLLVASRAHLPAPIRRRSVPDEA